MQEHFNISTVSYNDLYVRHIRMFVKAANARVHYILVKQHLRHWDKCIHARKMVYVIHDVYVICSGAYKYISNDLLASEAFGI